MLREATSHMEAAVVSSGHRFAAARLIRQLSLSGHVSELMGGLSQLHTLRATLAASRRLARPAILAAGDRLEALLQQLARQRR